MRPDDFERIPWWVQRLGVEGLNREYSEDEDDEGEVDGSAEGLLGLGINVQQIQAPQVTDDGV